MEGRVAALESRVDNNKERLDRHSIEIDKNRHDIDIAYKECPVKKDVEKHITDHEASRRFAIAQTIILVLGFAGLYATRIFGG